jgi:integrase/recombinase XerD
MDDTQALSTIVAQAPTMPSVDALLAGQLAQSSIDMYRRDVAAYSAWAGERGLVLLDPQTLMAWRDELVLHTDMSPNTINRMVAAIKRITREMADRTLLDEQVALKFEHVRGVSLKSLQRRLKRHARTRIEPDDMRTLCSAPDPHTLVGCRDRALLATLASSGLRAAELASLTLEQIKRRGKGYYLQVIGKTDVEPRDAHLSIEAYDLINVWIQRRPVLSQYIFTAFAGRGERITSEPLSESGVWKIVVRYAKACGLAHVKPHDFRRFVGTQLAATDIRKAQKALGHRSIEITARAYVLDELEIGLTDNLY